MTEDSKKTLPTPADRNPTAETTQDVADSKLNTIGVSQRGAGIDVQAYIGRQLRAVYDDVAKQPVPERFLDLMKQLEGIKPRG